MNYLYHATYTSRVKSIRRYGIVPASNGEGLSHWTEVNGHALPDSEYVFAFEQEEIAVCWGLKMQIESNGEKASVLRFLRYESDSWEPDMTGGIKLRGSIKPDRIKQIKSVDSIPLSAEMREFLRERIND